MGNFVDQIKMSASGPDASVVLLGSAVTGFLSLSQVIAVGAMGVGDNYVQFYIEDGAGNWEVSSYKIASPNSLVRNGVIISNQGKQAAVFPNGINLAWMTEQGRSRAPAPVSVSGPTNVVTALTDSTGLCSGLGLPNGRALPAFKGDWDESQWTRALLVAPPPRQINAVKDLSSWANDGHYLGSAVDADIYDSFAAYTPAAGTKPSGNWLATGHTNTGGSQTVLGTLANGNKALMLHNSKVQWDLDAGQSLLIQHRFFIPDNGTAATWPSATITLLGSMTTSAAAQGLNVGVAAASGNLSIGLKSGSANPVNQSSTYNAVPLLLNTPYCLSIYIDGALKTINAWINGQQKDSSSNIAVTGDTTVSPTNYSTINPSSGGAHMGIGCSLTEVATASNPQRLFTSHFRMTVLPSGLTLNNPQKVDYLFNRNPDRFMTDATLVGAF